MIKPTETPLSICVERQVATIKEKEEENERQLIRVESKCSVANSEHIHYQNSLNGVPYIPLIVDSGNKDKLFRKGKDSVEAQAVKPSDNMSLQYEEPNPLIGGPQPSEIGIVRGQPS